MSDQEKDLELMVLRYQLDLAERKLHKPVRPTQAERLKRCTWQPARELRSLLRLFQPETVLRWHRDLVRHKWRYARKNRGGRPPLHQRLEALILRLARENAS
jgi:putative transposase